MDSSKFLFSTLIAAAAMTATAYATDYEYSESSSSGTTLNNDVPNDAEHTITFCGALGYLPDYSNGTFSSNIILTDTASGGAAITINNGTSTFGITQTFSGSISGSGTFSLASTNQTKATTYIFTGDVTAFTGNIDASIQVAGTTNSTGGGIQFGSGAAYSTAATVTDGVISNISGTGTITAGNKLTYNYAVSESYTTLSIDNSSISAGTLTFQGGASYSVSSDLTAGTLTLSAGSLTLNGDTTLSSAISNSGTITFGEGANLALTEVTASVITVSDENTTGLQTGGSTYTIATGGTVSGLTTANVTVNGIGVTSVSDDGLSATISKSVYNIGTNDTVSYSDISADSLSAANYINVAGTLDYGTTSTGGTLAGGNLVGNGLVKWKNTNERHGTTVVISDEFSGTLQLTGNITSGNPLALGGTQSLVLDGVWFWGESVSTIRAATVLTDTYSITDRIQNVHFYLDGAGVNFTNSFDAEGKTVYLAGGTTTFAGDTKIGTLNLSGGSATIFGSVSADLKKIGSGVLTVSGSIGRGSTLEIAEGSATVNTRQSLGATIKVSAGTLSFSGDGNETFDANLEIGGGDSSVVVSAGWTDQVGTENSGESYIKVGKNGEFAMGDKRWGLVSTKKVILENGGKISGTGDSYGALDFNGANTISATGTGNEVSANIRLRTGALTFDVGAESDLTFSGSFNPNEKTTKQNGIIKSGVGTLTLSSDNSGVNYGTTTISAGTLVAANASALGAGAVTVKKDATLTFAMTVDGVTGGVEINEGATFAIDLTSFAQTVSEGDKVGFAILTDTALTFNGTGADTLSSGDIDSYFDVEGSTLGDYSDWAREWSYTGNTLSLTMTIPEPSAFGLLAGVGALALVVARRKRRK
ncbi:MAG: PEP-CTERM sorting domain-containing protein [Opitutales bacterium]|nr:PEP-CTERM sorting domain-containing protein [Opitutales bacterium]